MRIGVVTSSYPRHDGDAAGSFVAAHVEAMRAAGHEVDVVRAQTSALFDGGAPDALERGGWRTYVDAVRITAQLTAEVALRARRWDLAIAHWLVPSAIALLPTAITALPSRVPVLAIAHGGDVHTLRRLRLLAPALHALRARGTKLAFVSTELRDIARAAAPGLRSYLDEAIVQPMGIDVARFAAIARARRPTPQPTAQPTPQPTTQPTPQPTTQPTPRKTLLVAARLVPVKGVDIALAAYRELAAHRLLAAHRGITVASDIAAAPSDIAARAELVIAGDGPERARLEQLAADDIRRGDIRFLGAVDASTRDQLLARADVVVIPSRVLPNGRTEGAPMIALEALAAGVPVVASAVGGLRDLAAHAPGSVTLVAPDDPAALAAAIDRVLAAPTSAMRAASLDAFDWQHVATRLFAHAGIPETHLVCEVREAAGQASDGRGA